MTYLAVHLAQSYPTLIAQAADGADDATLLTGLAEVSLGEWAKITDQTAENTLGIAGVYRGAIRGVYIVTGWFRGEDGRIAFTGRPADEHAQYVGTHVEGGPWRRGESRPVRTVKSLALPKDNPSGTPGAANLAALNLLRGEAAVPLPESIDPLEGVRVRRDWPGGGVIVDVPLGLKVTIQPYSPEAGPILSPPDK